MKKTSVETYDKFKNCVSYDSTSNIIMIKDLDINFVINFKILFTDLFSVNTINTNYTIVAENVKCEEFNLIELTIDKLIIKHSTLSSLYISSSNISCLNVLDSSFKKLRICDSHIVEKLYIDSIKKLYIDGITIEDCIFDNTVVFSNITTFNSEILICGNETIFKKDLMFRDCLTINSTIDIRCTINENLSFLYLNQIDNENLELNYNMGNLLLYNSDIRANLNIINSSLVCVDIFHSIIHNIEENGFYYQTLKNDAPTMFRLAAINHGNIVREIHYSAEIYDRLLKEGTIKILERMLEKLSSNSRTTIKEKKLRSFLYLYIKEPIILFLTSILSQERLLLWLNKYSNDFNRSWARGVFFTCFFAFVFYFIINYIGCTQQYFIIDFEFNDFDKVCGGYLYLIDIFNFSNIDSPFKLTVLGKYILFFSRIILTYGIWQTIYAFYKYRK